MESSMTSSATNNSAQPKHSKHYDLVIIGTGSANSIPDENFAHKSIAIIEKGRFGGTCLNVGCIPTKMYVYAADIALAARTSQDLGIHGEITKVDWNSIVERVFANRIDLIAQGGEEYRRGDECPNIDVYAGHAAFNGPKSLTVTGAGADGSDCIVTGDEIVIATGSRPMIPRPIAESGAQFYTNEDIMRLDKQPESMIIVGAGFIAMEFAHVFHGLGTNVTVAVRGQELLKHLDHDIKSRFNKAMTDAVDIRFGLNITDVENTDHGVRVTYDDGSTQEADALLVATGRVPNGDQMHLDTAGIEMREDGRVKVDDYGRTTADGVWALGDVSSPYMLKHVANAETRALKHNMLHPEDLRPMPHDHVPSAIFTHPQIATVGMTEDEAKEAGFDITVKVQNYGDVAYGWAMNDSQGICKLIADRKTGRLLGAHYFGAQASTLIQQMVQVMAFDQDVRDVATKQYWIHPALPELTENALLGLEF
ncbi:mycothione reductase [Corynebacterium pseudodiphtheriticum]|uniref:mycothione reductase n=1 Tax=Corynebacterium pseudodiphtheriticum TaxID=37637 RepID=UPI003AF27E37